MSVALSSGVTGLESYQKMLDIAGDNLANVGTTAFKSSRITFSQLLSETIKTASQPTSTVGGTNPQQIGHGVGTASITPIMTQGNISNTGNPLDLAIEGEGYFVLSDGAKDLYTRAGAFAIDANSHLVDPATGYIVQRIGTTGETDGFQTAGNSDVRVPTDVSMPARATSEVRVAGNLSTTAKFVDMQINKLTSNIAFTVGGSPASATTKISEFDQYTGSTWADGTITFSGYKSDGTALGATPETNLEMPVTATTTLNDILTWLNTDDGMANEQQTITCSETDGGTFTVDFMSAITPVIIAYNATAATVKSKLEDLSTINAGDVIVTGGPMGGTGGSAVVVEFTGQYSGTDVEKLTIDYTGLSSTAGTAAALEFKQGTKAINEKQTISFTNATGGTYTLDFGNTGSPETISYGANAATVKAALANLSTLAATDLNVTGGGTGGSPVVIEFIGTKDGTDVSMLTIDDTNLTGTSPSASVAETVKGRGLQGVLGDDATASLVNGKIRITDAQTGHSQSDFKMAWSDSNLTMPAYFEVTTVGGEEVKNVNITVFDTQGGKHVLSGAFVRTNTSNTWDMILTSISGNITDITFDNRRINGLEFYANNGSYKGLNAATGDTAQFTVTFAHDPGSPQIINVSMGTVGQFNGLTQFDANSTAVAREQDGYAAGSFSNLSVSNDGLVIGSFTNGIKKDIATLQLALFQNPSALESLGEGYFSSSANSGEAIATQALSGGAGSLRGGALEGSNVNAAKEFISLIQSQNYYQANARTIRIANEMLRELTNLIR